MTKIVRVVGVSGSTYTVRPVVGVHTLNGKEDFESYVYLELWAKYEITVVAGFITVATKL